jgi:hypothetical protein
MEVLGKLHAKFDTQEVSASFRKRDFVLMVTENPQYPQYVVFQLVQDKCGLVDAFVLGAEITVFFNLRGRQWVNQQGETRYINSLEAWRITPGNVQHASNVVGAAPTVPPVEGKMPSIDVTQMDDSNDLPF